MMMMMMMMMKMKYGKMLVTTVLLSEVSLIF